MPQIFVFTAENPETRQHLADSIQNPIDDAVVFDNFDEYHYEELEGIRKEESGFYAWGAVPGIRNIPTWERMELNDFVLCVYDGAYHYVARLLGKYDNAECAEAIWGTNDKVQTWRYMYFLTKPIEVDEPLYEFEGYLHSGYQGFTRISDARLKKIEEDFGSVEALMMEMLVYAGEWPPELDPATGRSRRMTEDSLQVDDVAHDTVDEKTPSDSAGRRLIEAFRKWHWSNLFRLRWQITLSAVVAIMVIAFTLTTRFSPSFDRFGRLDFFVSVMMGIASILALVGSITFGFLLYYMQSVVNEKYNMYSSFKERVRSLRDFLDELYENGAIDATYDYHLGLLESLTLDQFPILAEWNETIDPLVDVITEDQRESLESKGAFGRVLRGFAYRLNDIEEMKNGLFMNFVKQVLIRRIVEPVVKAFATLAAVVLTVLVALLIFDQLPTGIAWGIGTGFGFMTFLLLVEIAKIVQRETKELYEFKSSDDDHHL
jgi:hypothetical protein